MGLNISNPSLLRPDCAPPHVDRATSGGITGIGTTLFSQFTNASVSEAPTIQQVMAIALAALTLLGLGIFGPSIANGIVSGGPQLGAGTAAGTALAAGATIADGAAVAGIAGGAAAGAMGTAAMGGARAAGGASAAYQAGAAGKSGGAAVASGLAGVGRNAGSAAMSPLRKAAGSIRSSLAAGRSSEADASPSSSPAASASGQPVWAAAMKRRQALTHGAGVAAQTLKSGDSHGGAGNLDISEKD